MRFPRLAATLALAACAAPRPDAAPVTIDGPGLAGLTADAAYRFAWTDTPSFADLPGFQARQGRLRVHVAPDGLSVVDRAQVAPSWVVGLKAARFGREGAVRPLPTGHLWAEHGVLDLVRGSVVEYAENDVDGFEHGFRLNERPDGSGPVRVEIAVDGAEVRTTDDGALFGVPGEAVVGWRELKVFDASGHTVPARTELTEDGFAVVVDDRAARWPLVVDPMLTSLEQAITGTSSEVGDDFGRAVDVYGDVVVVGAPGAASATRHEVVLRERNSGGSNAWGQSGSKLDTTNSASEGRAVSLEEDVVAFGAPTVNTVTLRFRDRAGAFDWTEVVTGSSGFGTAVELVSDGLVVGAPNGSEGGKVHLYSRYIDDDLGDPSLEELPYTSRFDSASGDQYGAAIAAWGNYVLVGAPGGGYAVLHQILGNATNALDAGVRWTQSDGFGTSVAVHDVDAVIGDPVAETVSVYHREAAWSSATEQVLLPPEGAGAGFGTRVATNGEVIAVTDDGDPVRVFLYEWSGLSWGHVQTLDTGGITQAGEPASLSVGVNSVVVGLPYSNSVQVYRRGSDRFVSDTFVDPNGATSDRFGAQVAVGGDLVVVGAPQADPTGVDSGEVHFFRRVGEGAFEPLAVVAGAAAGDELGYALTANEGIVAIGAPFANGEEGLVQLHEFDGVTLDPTPTTLRGPSSGMRFGMSVAADGLKVVVGIPGFDDDRGGMRIYGRLSGWRQFPDTTPDSTFCQGLAQGDQMGLDAAAVSGGWAAISSGAAEEQDGSVCLVNFVEGGDQVDTVRIAGAAYVESRFGSSLALDGDVLVAGARKWDNTTGLDVGAITIHRLTPPGWTAELLIEGAAAGQELGSAVSLRGSRLYAGASGGNRVQVRERNLPAMNGWGKVGSDLTGNAGFGASVDADDQTVVIGAPSAVNGTGEVVLFEVDANVPPLCHTLRLNMAEDGVKSISPTFDDPNGDSTRNYSLVSAPAHGDVAIGALTYTPDPNYHGVDSFRLAVDDGALACDFDVIVDIAEVNDPPAANDDAGFFGDEDTDLVVSAVALLANDSDPDVATGVPTVLSLNSVTTAANGTVRIQGTNVVFEPEPDWFGTTTFTYTIKDDGSPVRVSPPAEVSIEVRPVNDPPVLQQSAYSFDGGVLPAAVEDQSFVSPPPGLRGAVSDVDGDVLTIGVVDQPDHGQLSVEANGYWVYVPAANWSGVDAFQYEVSDGTTSVGPVTVQITVVPENDAPVALGDGVFRTLEDQSLVLSAVSLLANDGDVDPGSTLSLSLVGNRGVNGDVELLADAVRFVPDRNYVGSASFEYVIEDEVGAVSSPTTVTLDVVDVNDTPAAVADTLQGPTDTVLAGDLLANDIDIDGDPLTAGLVGLPLHGTATVASDGSATYEADDGYVGADSFTYSASDGRGGVVTGTVTVLVGAPTTEGPTDTGVEGPSACDDPRTFYVDRDGDGFGDPNASVIGCEARGWVEDDTDCDDYANDVFPGAKELSGDERDQDCDGRDNVVVAPAACDHGSAGGLSWSVGALVLLAARRRVLR